MEDGGSGLGLFISRQLTELQGGEIGIGVNTVKGSTFVFFIKGRRARPPIGSPTPKTVAPPSPAHLPKTSGLPAPSFQEIPLPRLVTLEKLPLEPLTKPLDLLLVEDNVVNQKVLAKQLRKAGYVLTIANHGQEALEAIEKTALWSGNTGVGGLDVILMDVEMPVMDGLTCTRRIRELQKTGQITKHVPIIAVTANARREQVETSLNAGMVCIFVFIHFGAEYAE